MENLIKVNYENEQPTVSARDLHDGLGIKTAFKDWFPRMCEYGFVEGIDFCSKMSESTGGRPAKEYDVSIDMAKQICMIQRSDKGRQYRQYFIDLEKAWNTPEQVMARALKMADTKIKELRQELDDQAPLVDFARQVHDTEDLLSIGDFAKLLNDEGIKIGRNNLFAWLRNEGYLMMSNVPYQTYIDRGYFKVKESVFYSSTGNKINLQTYVTGKGQQYISQKLREYYDRH